MRRSFRHLFVVLTFLGFSASAIASADDARHFVEGVSSKALGIIETKSFSDADKFSKLSDLFAASVDTNWMGRFAIGQHWRNFNEDQKKNYLELYGNFLLNSYVPKFREYNNQKLDIKKIFSENANEYTVQTEIISKEGKVFRVDYRIHTDREGTYKIFDVVAEGVSLITTQRSDFSSILADQGADYFIGRLKERIVQLKPAS